MKKKAVSGMMLTLVFSVMLTLVFDLKLTWASPETILYVDSLSNFALPSETFTVNIIVADVEFLYAWQVNMSFNPNVLGFVNVTEGDFLKRQPEGTEFAGLRLDPTEGWLFFGWTTVSEYSGVSGSGILATVEFEVLDIGESALTFEKLENVTGGTYLLGQTQSQPPPYFYGIPFVAENGLFRTGIPGDVNGDRIVDIFDIGTISAHWYPGPPIGPLGYDANADVNYDGAVDIFDIGITSAHWGEVWTKLIAPVISDPALTPSSESFRINITVFAVQNLCGYQFILNYNTSILTAIDLGSYTPFNTHLFSEIDDTAGYVSMAYWTWLGDPNGFSTTDPTPIAWIEFMVGDVGTSALDLHDTAFSDPYGNPILHNEVDGSFSNQPP